MVGLLISLTLIATLAAALQPAHRTSWRPGYDSVSDRDRARLIEELNLLDGFDSVVRRPEAAAVDRPRQELRSTSGRMALPASRWRAHPRWFISSRSERNRRKVATALASTSTTISAN